MFNKISEDPPSVSVHSNASGTGWGAHFQRGNIGGNWSLEEKSYPINVEEMLAVYFSLKCFTKDFSNVTVKIHIDNIAVVSILKTWVHPTMNCLTKNVNLYGNGVSLRTSGYSQIM